MMSELLSRFRFFLAGRDRSEVDEELQFHLDQQINTNLQSGMSPAEAERQAAIAFGGLQRTREQCREQYPRYWLETLLQDIRYSIRGFRRNPAFSLAVVVTLMLGIGSTTAVVSVIDRILFRSLPYGDSSRLVSIGLTAPIEPQEFVLGGSYYEWQDNQKPFVSLTSETGVEPCDLTENSPARLNCAHAEANFLSTLGVVPILGRNFAANEDRPNGPKVALLTYALWHSRLPASFEMPRLQAADVLLPQALDVAAQRRADPGRPLWAFGRLKPGVTPEQARAELEPLFQYSLRLAPAPFRKEVHLQVRSLRDRQFHEVHQAAWILLGLVAAVLLIACANVTSLMMARGASREKELAVRSALGAGRMRLLRQALTESLALSLAGGASGCLFALLLLRFFIFVAPGGMPFLTKAQIDLRILAFALATTVICAIFFGLIAGLRSATPQVLASRTRTASHQALLRRSLVIVQIAMSMVLLAGAALLARSFLNLQQQRLGMTAQNVVAATISLGPTSYPTQNRQMAFYLQLERSLRFGPGITSVAVCDSLPPGGNHHDTLYANIHLDGQPGQAFGTGGNVYWRWVTPEYFQTLQIPIIQGQAFSDSQLESTDRFVVLSQSLADRVFPAQNPIGQPLRLARGAPPDNDPIYTVVGVAANVKNGGLAAGEEPEYYRLRRHQPQDWDRGATIILKTTLPPGPVESWIRSQVAMLDPTLPVEITTLSERVDKMADQPRFEALLVSFFACMGLALAMVGLYGVITFLVVQRTQEIGVRMALGATRIAIVRLVLASAVRLIAPGVLLGLALALALSRFLSSLLFNLGPHDPLAFVSVTGLLAVVAILASLIPGASAARVDPIVALRCE
jgi:predicted permease